MSEVSRYQRSPSKFGESREGIFVCLRSVDIGGLPVNLVRAEREYLCV